MGHSNYWQISLFILLENKQNSFLFKHISCFTHKVETQRDTNSLAWSSTFKLDSFILLFLLHSLFFMCFTDNRLLMVVKPKPPSLTSVIYFCQVFSLQQCLLQPFPSIKAPEYFCTLLFSFSSLPKPSGIIHIHN